MSATATVLHPEFKAKSIRRKLSIKTPMGKYNNHWVTVEHKEDPRQVLLTRIGDVPKGLVQFTKILVAVYRPPIVEKSEGGIILPDTVKESDVEEYIWQGKVGLIVAMGDQAYVDDDNVKFHGTRNEVGDWVWFRPSDGMACEVNEVFCRLFTERDIIGRVPHPDAIW